MASAEAKTQDLENKVSGLAARLTDLEKKLSNVRGLFRGVLANSPARLGR
jgi:hypothetical protein